MTGYLNKAKAAYAQHWARTNGEPAGSSPEKIARAEDLIGVPLCAAHREFALWAGDQSTGVLSSHDWLLSDTPRLTAMLPDVVENDGLDYEIPPGTVCFFSHEGCVFSWYVSDPDEPDPICFTYVEGDPELTRERFSEVILFNVTT